MEPSVPLPFRLKVPDRDSLELTGIRSVSYEMDGLVRVDGDALAFEWVARRHTERIGLTGIREDVEESPVGSAQIPLARVSRARLRGFWWAPRLEVYARQVQAFDEIPTARGGVLTLRISRHDRALAARIIAAVQAAPALGSADRARLPAPDHGAPPAIGGGS
jgi:hypothetical protein